MAYQRFSVSPKLKGPWNFVAGRRHAAEFDLCVLQCVVASLPSLSLLCLNVFLPSSSVLHNYFNERMSVLVILTMFSISCSWIFLEHFFSGIVVGTSGIKLLIEKTVLDKAGGVLKGLQLFYMKSPFLGMLFRLLPSKCENFHTGI